MDILGIILILLCIASVIYHILAAYCAGHFYIRYIKNIGRYRREKGDYEAGKYPKVLCFKPLCGEDRFTFNNVGSFMNMFYPEYKHKLLLGIADYKDPAYKNVARVLKRVSPYRVIISLGEIKTGSNAKVRNMMNMERYIPPGIDVVIISDADVRVEADYIRAMVEPFLEDPNIGATTAIYKIARDVELPEVLEAAFVGLNFIPSVLLVSHFSDLKYAFGASIAIRADVLEKIGGFSSLKDYLADDYMLAQKIVKAGYKIKLVDYIVDIMPSTKRAKDAILHILRWMRTIKTCNPLGYFFSIVCYPTLWGVLACFYFGPASFGVYLLGLCGFTRMICSALYLAWTKNEIFKAVAAPAWDWITTFMWIWSFLGNTVKWNNKEYKVLSDGRFYEIKEKRASRLI